MAWKRKKNWTISRFLVEESVQRDDGLACHLVLIGIGKIRVAADESARGPEAGLYLYVKEKTYLSTPSRMSKIVSILVANASDVHQANAHVNGIPSVLRLPRC
jgi:hypothetical protein